jgi:hypothetical protein
LKRPLDRKLDLLMRADATLSSEPRIMATSSTLQDHTRLGTGLGRSA